MHDFRFDRSLCVIMSCFGILLKSCRSVQGKDGEALRQAMALIEAKVGFLTVTFLTYRQTVTVIAKIIQYSK